MAVAKSVIDAEIKWYNEQITLVKDNIVKRLKELGHTVEIKDINIKRKEELSGTYDTHQFDLIIDNDLKISLIPYGIWIVGAKGRIEINGPAGSEKLVYFLKGGPAISTEIKNESGTHVEKQTHKYFNNVDDEDWYWYDDSSYRKVTKFTKEIVDPLLETIQ